MASVQKPLFTAPVREIVEFALRTGDLGGTGDFVGPNRALAGTRGHQRLQRSRPEGYQKEVPLAYEVEIDEIILRVQGRIDGLLLTPEGVFLEEIKTVQGHWDGTADPLHWAQAKFYAFVYGKEKNLEQITIQLTYLNLDSGEVKEFRECVPFSDLKKFFEDAVGIYLEWIRERYNWSRERDRSIQTLAFPFPDYRPGQRSLAVAAYRTYARGGRLFIEAPTGIGKTISVLYPALKAMAEGKLERIFYLTARTVGRTVAEKAFADLRSAGLRLRVLFLTAKEKICFQDGHECDTRVCPFAHGYYDRWRTAMRDALAHESITRPVLEEVARRHLVCPFDLSLDLSMWVDAIVCDYNYAFDPKVYLRRHFNEQPGDYAFLVDEAHNLVDRARDMFSADLNSAEIRETSRAIKTALPRCAKALTRLNSEFRKLATLSPSEDGASECASAEEMDLFGPKPHSLKPGASSLPPHATKELPTVLIPPIEEAVEQAEIWLARNEPAEFRETLLALYFRLNSFLRTAELYDERYVTIIEGGRAPGVHSSISVRLFCLDPSFLLAQAVQRGKAAVIFSATLTPLDYYRTLLGGAPEDPVLQLPSPFPPENLAVLVHQRIRTHFRARAESLGDVVQAIEAVVQAHPGNYLVYFPSYQYLQTVQEKFQHLNPSIPILVQRSGMTETEREEFLKAFTEEHAKPVLGFAVLGGIFGEGIDLVGEHLIGAIVVGVGLPQLCMERDLISAYFHERTGMGFDYAYTFPGMNRVLQATGRVIRSETDRGLVLLIDTRFMHARYRQLFPPWWQPVCIRSTDELKRVIQLFWAGGRKLPGNDPEEGLIPSDD